LGVAGEDRLETAGRLGIPQIIAPGGIDVISKGPIDTLLPEERRRIHYRHSPFFTHVRVSREEMRRIGEVIGEKLNRGLGPSAVAVPLRGFSDRNRPGDLFFDPEADGEFILTLKKKLDPRVRVMEVDAHINDALFASRASDLLIEMLEADRVKG
jgi:uncharacterized protein (UPF0261 family)